MGVIEKMVTVDRLSKQVEQIEQTYEQRQESQKVRESQNVPTDVVEWAAQIGIEFDDWQLTLMRELQYSQENHTPLRAMAATGRQCLR
jgi:hypothetical protein